jgi:sterol desaturase/sphingolipid hydroxylase (fatty acid hydroxylase superfamily)
MTELDRYDFALTLVAGLIMIGVLLLGAPFWALLLIAMVTVGISVLRHAELRPRGSPHRR